MTKLTWKLPLVRPRFVARGPASHWKVIPDKAFGMAWAVCMPVGSDPSGWRLMLANPAAPVPTTEAPIERWTELSPQLAGAGASHLLSLLGYDQPPAGGGGTFAVDDYAAAMPAALQAVIDELQAQMGEEFADWLVACDPPAPPTPTASPVTLPVLAPSMALRSEPAPQRLASSTSTTAATTSLTLAFASCQYPSGLLDKLPAQRSYERLASLLNTPGARAPTVLLLLGDQVYVDATAGLLDPMRLDDRYRVPYEELQKIEPLQRILQGRLRTEWMLDDHEIADNWEPRQHGDTGPLYDKGLAAYWAQQRAEQPKAAAWSAYPATDGWALFVADTRSERGHRCEATLASAEIVGPAQRSALEQWLLASPKDDLKLVASPAMLLPRLAEHREEPLHHDCWQGYPASLHGLLAFLCDHEIPNVHFLSGDAHLGCDVRITVTGNGKSVATRSTHAPALYAPLPFANSHPWDFTLPDDSFRFPDPVTGPYTCDVTGGVLPGGDGSCLLKADRTASGWKVTTEVV